jgi:ketosteroid isomerase-like protein
MTGTGICRATAFRDAAGVCGRIPRTKCHPGATVESPGADTRSNRKSTPLRLGMLLAMLSGCTGPARSSGSDAALADTLKARIAEAYDFSRPGAVERMNALYPDTGRVISASGGQFTVSPDSLRAGIAAFWKNVGQNMKNPRWQWGDVYVDRLGDDAAVLTGTWSIPHIAPTGLPHTIRGAWTAVFRRIGGRWLIVAEHLSTPPS